MDKQKLGDIATVEISGVDKKTKDGEQEIRLCNFVDVYYNWAITTAQHDGFMFATARPNEISKFQLKKGQVALTKDSETRDDIGVPTYIADDFDDVILGYHCALITPNKDILDGRYLNALLHTDYAKKYFACNASGSGQRYALSVEALNSFPVPMIPLRNQERIGEIFSALDKKIELNRRINQNLEAMAKQFYDYWFVQFDFPNEEGKPYKSSGGKMVWNEKLKRNIPVGWHCGNLFEIAVFTNGLACQKFRPKDDEESLPVIKIREMHDGISDDTEEVTSNIPESVKGIMVMCYFHGRHHWKLCFGLMDLEDLISISLRLLLQMISRSHFTIFNFWIILMYLRKWQKQGKQRWDILRKIIYNKAQLPYLIIKILRLDLRN